MCGNSLESTRRGANSGWTPYTGPTPSSTDSPRLSRHSRRKSIAIVINPLRFLLVALLAACIGTTSAAEGDLIVAAPGKASVELSIDAIRGLPSKIVLVKDEAGNPAQYRGVRLAEVLARAGFALPELKGKLLSQTLLATASDGYTVA